MTNRPEIDKFADEVTRAMSASYRRLVKPKDRMTRWLWIGWTIITVASVVQAIVYWSVR